MASVTCGLTAEDRNQFRNPTLVSSMGLPLSLQTVCRERQTERDRDRDRETDRDRVRNRDMSLSLMVTVTL